MKFKDNFKVVRKFQASTTVTVGPGRIQNFKQRNSINSVIIEWDAANAGGRTLLYVVNYGSLERIIKDTKFDIPRESTTTKYTVKINARAQMKSGKTIDGEVFSVEIWVHGTGLQLGPIIGVGAAIIVLMIGVFIGMWKKCRGEQSFSQV